MPKGKGLPLLIYGWNGSWKAGNRNPRKMMYVTRSGVSENVISALSGMLGKVWADWLYGSSVEKRTELSLSPFTRLLWLSRLESVAHVEFRPTLAMNHQGSIRTVLR